MSTAPSPWASPTPTSPPATNTTSPSLPSNSVPPPSSASPPPPTTTPSTSPPPAFPTPPSDAKTPPSPATQRSPPPPSGSGSPSTPSPPSSTSSLPKSSSSSTPAGVFVGVAVGAVAIILVLSILCFCCRKKKRRDDQHNAPPQGPKDQGRNAATHQTNDSYDVFLSFCGPDTRYSFTGSLYDALTSKGFKVFMDDQAMKPGDRISQTLVNAIRQSRISIVVLSQDYASSTWCLDELVQILECMRLKNQLVWPIFYKVAPSDVRLQRKSYAEGMAKHYKKFGKGSQEVQKWRTALTEVAGVEGWPNTAGRYDHELIKEIVKRARTTLKREQLDVGEHMIIHQSCIEKVKSLLDIESHQTPCMLGIHGIGGMGKTTLAKALYNLINHQFDYAIFLEDVREKSSSPGLVCLQEEILSKFEGGKKKLGGVSEGVTILKDNFQGQRVLLFLDDVDEKDQLEKLAGNCNWFGSGSRIIITTRDKNVLDHGDVEKRFEMKGLNDDEALQLFCLKAFKDSQPPMNYEEVSKRVVQYARGLPLALKVIGSHFFKRSVKACEDALKQYDKIPDKKIQGILKISYDCLDDSAKSIFLDIACFFKGKRLDYVDQVWEKCDFVPSNNVGILEEKSLITIENGELRMHDLIQDMGKEIVRTENPNNPGNRSRLYFHQDVLNVLRENLGSNEIRGIMLDPPEEEEVNWNDNAFKKMTKLRILIIRKTHFTQNLDYLPNSLLLLDWKGYPSKSLPSCFDQIVVLNLPYSHLTFEEAESFQKLEHLTCCDFSMCKYITRFPDVSEVPNLSELDLSGCTNLTAIHHSVGFLQNLKRLNAYYCEKLQDLPSMMLLPSLQVLILTHTSIASIPEVSGVPNLSELDLSGCTNLTDIHHSVGFLQNLKSLSAFRCEKLKDLPSMMSLPSLQDLVLTNTSISSIPDVSGVPNLSQLDLSGCRNLTAIHHSVGFLQNLKRLDASCCGNLQDLPPTMSLPSLQALALNRTSIASIPDMSGVPNLSQLDLNGCGNLTAIHHSVGFLQNLKHLNASHCYRLQDFPPRMWLPSLQHLDLSRTSMESFPHIEEMMCAPLTIRLYQTPIKELLLDSISNLVGLKMIQIGSKSVTVGGLPSELFMLPNMSTLGLYFCGAAARESIGRLLNSHAMATTGPSTLNKPPYSPLTKFSCCTCGLTDEDLDIILSCFPNLQELEVRDNKFVSLPASIKRFAKLRVFDVAHCLMLEEIPELPNSIVKLYAEGCPCLSSEAFKMLWSQARNEVYGLEVFMPGLTEIPDWFDYHCQGGIVSFQARRKFPLLAIAYILEEHAQLAHIHLYINGDHCKSRDCPPSSHLLLSNVSFLDFQCLFYGPERSSLDPFLVHEWNYVEIKFECDRGKRCNNANVSSCGAYVYKQQTNMEDIRFRVPIH